MSAQQTPKPKPTPKPAPAPKATAQPAEKPCPICRKPAVERFRPFCSKRCADVDLNRWLTGAYAIPVTPEEDEDGDGGQGER